MYIIYWNTGDEFWDNTPDCESFAALAEVEEAIGRTLTAEEIADHYATDEEGIIYSVEW